MRVGIVYDENTGEPRKIIIPDREEELDDPAHHQKGHAMLRVDQDEWRAKVRECKGCMTTAGKALIAFKK